MGQDLKVGNIEVLPLNWRGQEAWHCHGPGMLQAALALSGVEAKVIPLKRLKTWDDFYAVCSDCDVFTLTIMSRMFPLSKQIARRLKEKFPERKILAGGIHCTVAPQEILACSDFDFVFQGEGEETLPKFLTDGGLGRDERLIRCETVKDLNLLPYMDRSQYIIPLEENCWGPGMMASFLASRSCPYRCCFCFPAERNHFGRYRRRSVEHFIKEIEHVVSTYRPDSIVFHDDTFVLGNEKWEMDFISRYRNIGLPFWISSRADIVCKKPHIVEALKDVGCYMFSIGFESGSQRILDLMNKGTTVEQNLEAARILANLGLVIYCNIMIGNPTETRAEMIQTYEMVHKMQQMGTHVSVSVAFFSPYPGSQWAKEAIESGDSMLTEESYDRYPGPPRLKSQLPNHEFMCLLRDGKFDQAVKMV